MFILIFMVTTTLESLFWTDRPIWICQIFSLCFSIVYTTMFISLSGFIYSITHHMLYIVHSIVLYWCALSIQLCQIYAVFYVIKKCYWTKSDATYTWNWCSLQSHSLQSISIWKDVHLFVQPVSNFILPFFKDAYSISEHVFHCNYVHVFYTWNYFSLQKLCLQHVSLFPKMLLWIFFFFFLN